MMRPAIGRLSSDAGHRSLRISLIFGKSPNASYFGTSAPGALMEQSAAIDVFHGFVPLNGLADKQALLGKGCAGREQARLALAMSFLSNFNK